MSGTTAGTKRKLAPDKPQKYYAVRAGFKPGVYLSWPECQSQISGFKGAQYKSFLAADDARAFVAGKNPMPIDDKAAGKAQDKFYAVARGNKPGIYTDWETASLAIAGAKGPKYKRFATVEEAAAFIREWQSKDTGAARFAVGAVKDANAEAESEEEEEDQPPVKKAKKANKAKTAPSAAPAPGKKSNVIDIYTDGSCLGNGVHGAVAGVGVWFGAGDARNISERLQGEPQTNQRAELSAILRTLQTVAPEQPIRIFSDSKYAINCVTDWAVKWQLNGWRTAGGPVKNQDIVQAVLARMAERKAKGTATEYVWVKGHATDVGNIAADALAVRGARS